MLSNLHGIGFIRLDRKNFSERKTFLLFKLIRQFYQTGEFHQFDWDYFSEELLALLPNIFCLQ
ncbi:hypothetical protein AT241_06680 [Bartonella henselae]|nr:hypothetical protein AT243_03810 [Bartonella henselae]OLL49411.1 hypothetical protein AT247_00580 [Bartonella henselae]OLL50941.1 hypothetical protein AT241_06680 [Bartonella henselae]